MPCSDSRKDPHAVARNSGKIPIMKAFVLFLALSAVPLAGKSAVGPAHGALVICGGGRLGPEILNEFFSLAGGPDAPIVFIPTASEANAFPPDYLEKTVLFKA